MLLHFIIFMKDIYLFLLKCWVNCNLFIINMLLNVHLVFSCFNFQIFNFRNGWAEAMTQIRRPYVKVICPSA